MHMKCIGVRSVTYAEKARELLKPYGINAIAAKRPGISSTGCGWCVKVPFSQSETALTLMKNNGVRLTGEIYDLS